MVEWEEEELSASVCCPIDEHTSTVCLVQLASTPTSSSQQKSPTTPHLTSPPLPTPPPSPPPPHPLSTATLHLPTSPSSFLLCTHPVSNATDNHSLNRGVEVCTHILGCAQTNRCSNTSSLIN
ncbi:unnamed protein product [Hydatigera taeniaeformis]|uniref:Uncharacterized protein n=1 Tax=Hydatigena taeniaeformis TaxID=6205 RepID=A0A0R3XDG1_HYDTA|nr:unnamed protein product [Hydatigera taeniaeformis]